MLLYVLSRGFFIRVYGTYISNQPIVSGNLRIIKVTAKTISILVKLVSLLFFLQIPSLLDLTSPCTVSIVRINTKIATPTSEHM